MATLQWVVFSINGDDFGVDISQVNIIERPVEIFKIPNAPDFVEGLINLRGKVYTVFNLRRKFGLPAKETDDSTKIIMVNTTDATVGIVVDEVKEIVKVEEKNIENAPEIIGSTKGKYVTSVAKIDDRIIMLLNLDNVFAAEALV
ncbi:MAG: purine-binding chemotaxis protein CheW [Clostridiales bacterium]|nr:purine-binding chemotaxis protein CheW [Clostridiales bacterium]